MFTGWPGLVGWEYHLWQRNHARTEIQLRQEDLQVLFAGTDPMMIDALARRYDIGAVCAWGSAQPALARGGAWRTVVTSGGATLAMPREGAGP
jgi:hypothetical protein